MPQHASSNSAVVPLERKVAHLSQPDTYPEATRSVEVIETHMAWVFLTDRHAYKLKKPVILPFLDFGTVEARRHDCEEEVRLNGRLAPNIYLGIVALTLEADGRLSLGGEGRVVDWLVKMVRLAGHRMLDRVLAADAAHESDIVAIATVLAEFYRSQPPVHLEAASYRRFFLDEAARTLEALVALGGADHVARAERVVAAQRAFVAHRSSLLEERVLNGRIVEGHGDLRPEHVYLDGRPVIIDCLEFNRALRLADPVDELAFLALECGRRGAGWVRPVLLATYARLSGDHPAPGLIDFYTSFRAGLRARLAAWHMREPGKGRTPAVWRDRADEYLALAEAHAARASRPVPAGGASAREEVH